MSKRHPLQATKIFFSYWISPIFKRFQNAIETEHVPQILDLFIQRRSLINESIDLHGNTGLSLAIQSGRIKSIKILLKLGSNPNIGNIYDNTHPLYILAKLPSNNKPKIPTIAKMLLNAGSDPFYQHTDLKSSIPDPPILYCSKSVVYLSKDYINHVLVRTQNELLLKIFIDYKIDISPLILIAQFGDCQICKFNVHTTLCLAIQNPSIFQLLLDSSAKTVSLK